MNIYGITLSNGSNVTVQSNLGLKSILSYIKNNIWINFNYFGFAIWKTENLGEEIAYEICIRSNEIIAIDLIEIEEKP